MTINYPNIDPVIISLGPLSINWYSLSYVFGIVLGWQYIRYLSKSFGKSLPNKVIDDAISWAILGVVIGGRLGYVFFYGFEHYISNPLEIIKTWTGGMSFHGGLLGMITAIYIMCKLRKINFLEFMDLIACAAPIGLFLGRIANFINGGLYGRVTDMPWGVVFPYAGAQPRHPSQLYEAFFEGFVLFIILFFSYRKHHNKRGLASGLFLMMYGIFRASIEMFRAPDQHIGFIYNYFTLGQILCVPMIIIGFIIVVLSTHEKVRARTFSNTHKT